MPPQFTGKDTFFGKTASLLQGPSELGNIQKILLQLMIVLVGISLVLCGAAFGYMLSKGETVKHALEFTVVLLIASIPLAIEIVVTATLALGSRQLSGHGAIVTRLTAIEEMAGMNMLCSDKTGTLTLNKMVIQVRRRGWGWGWGCGLHLLDCICVLPVPASVLPVPASVLPVPASVLPVPASVLPVPASVLAAASLRLAACAGVLVCPLLLPHFSSTAL